MQVKVQFEQFEQFAQFAQFAQLPQFPPSQLFGTSPPTISDMATESRVSSEKRLNDFLFVPIVFRF